MNCNISCDYCWLVVVADGNNSALLNVLSFDVILGATYMSKVQGILHLRSFNISTKCASNSSQPTKQITTAGKPYSFSDNLLMPSGHFHLPILPTKHWSSKHSYYVRVYLTCPWRYFDHIASPPINHHWVSSWIKPDLTLDWHYM